MIISSRDCDGDSAPGWKATEWIPNVSLAGMSTTSIVGAAARGAEESEIKGARLRLLRQPRARADEAVGEQADVEAQMRGAQVGRLLVAREQIDQQRPHAPRAQHLGHVSVARAETARATAV